MLYGEVFADAIDPPCGEGEDMEPCITGRWVSPVVMSIYLLVANILLINLLIAVFNNIFNEVNAVSHQVWMFQRFTVVMEYEQKPVLPPPLILLCHLYLLFKTVARKLRGRQSDSYDNGLKVFLEPSDLDRLYDFGEYLKEKESSPTKTHPDFATLFPLNVVNFLTGRDNLMINPIFELLSSRSFQNISNMIGYL